MTRTQDIGHCKRCGFQWVIGESRPIYNRRGRGEGPRERRSIACPLCLTGDIRIEKEDLNEQD